MALPFVALTLLVAMPVAGASAQTPTPQGAPVLVYQSVNDGDSFKEPVFVIQLCFASPINIRDQTAGGDFAYSVTEPDNLGLGHRDVFQVDAYGVAIYPGNAPGETVGEWTFTWRVTSPDAQHAATGTIKYTVDPNAPPGPKATPPACVAAGGTATATEVPPSGEPSGSAVTTPAPSGSVTATPLPVDTESSGPDILKLALLTIGVAGAAAVLALIGYFIRRRVGFDWHKPGDGDSGHH